MTTPSQIRAALERKTLWLSSWMIHNANAVRSKGRIKVGGHQVSSASSNAILHAASALAPGRTARYITPLAG